MTREDHNAYALGFRKTFEKCKRDHQEFELGKSLLGIVIDWCDAEIRGLRDAVGTEIAKALLKGCQVHWNRSWQLVQLEIALCQPKKKHLRKVFLEKFLMKSRY